jgi:hypothetical protein
VPQNRQISLSSSLPFSVYVSGGSRDGAPRTLSYQNIYKTETHSLTKQVGTLLLQVVVRGGERREELREKERGNVSTSEPKKHGGAAITGQEAAPNAPHAKTARGKTALAVPLS